MREISASVIIPALNEELYLPLLLNSLRGLSAPVDIIVVDGSSKDRTVQAVKELQIHFKPPSSLTIVEDAKRNISHQRNLGASKARSDVLVFCDADVTFAPGSFDKMVSDFRNDTFVVAAPKLIPLEPGLNFKILYWLLGIAEQVLHACNRAYFPGSCILTRKETFIQTGGFDEGIPLGEDVDYSLRASKTGKSGILKVNVSVSMRRYMKYGYSWIFSEIPNVVRLIVTGRIKHETIYYPFGGYAGHEAHHVTGNTHGGR